MRNHVHRTSANGSDTARELGRKARNALPAVRTETSDMIPAAGNILSRAMYTTSYGVSYGMIFPVLLMARAVPRENALVHGLADGAKAARDQVASWLGARDGVEGDQEKEGEESDEDGESSSDQNGATLPKRQRRQGAGARSGRQGSRSARRM